jgi:prepilin-type processing-associated H-X9-DG protein
VELLVVIGIVGALLAMLLPAVQRARMAALRGQCGNNLRQIGLALHHYHDTELVLPPGIRRTPDPFPFLGWTARILPYIEQQGLWDRASRDFAGQRNFWGPPTWHAGLGTVVTLYNCPAQSRSSASVLPENVEVAFTDYLGVIGRDSGSKDGVLYLDSRVRLSGITDGTSTTLMVGERPPSPDNRFGWWYAGVGQSLDGSADMLLGVQDYRTTFRAPTCPWGPYYFGPGNLSNMCDTFHFWSLHTGGGANFLFCDGSVHFIPYSAKDIMPALATRAGGEPVEWPN